MGLVGFEFADYDADEGGCLGIECLFQWRKYVSTVGFGRGRREGEGAPKREYHKTQLAPLV